MPLDAYKEKIRNRYVKEYARKLPMSWLEKAFAYPAAALIGASMWTLAGSALAGAMGALAAPVWLTAGILMAAGGAAFGVATMVVGKERARKAIEADIENGTLVKRYEQELATPAPKVAQLAPAAASFNAPASAQQRPAAQVPAVKPVAPQPPAL